ncbi:hypothetical protein [Pseudonocardia sp.]
MPTRDDPPSSPRATRILIALGVAVAVIVFIALHLTGVIGPASH